MNATNENEPGESGDDLQSFLAYLKQDPDMKRKIEAELAKLIEGHPSFVIMDDEPFWAELRNESLGELPEWRKDQ